MFMAFDGDEVFCRVHFLRFVLKERDCSLRLRPGRAGPLRTKRTRVCPCRRAAEHQQPSDGGRRTPQHPKTFACRREVARSNQRHGHTRVNTIESHVGECPVRCGSISHRTNWGLPNLLTDLSGIRLIDYPRTRTFIQFEIDPPRQQGWTADGPLALILCWP